MQADRRPRLGPGRAPRADADRARRRLRRPLARGSPRSAASCSSRRSTGARPASSSSAEQDDDGGHLRREDRARRPPARSRHARPTSWRAAVRALTPHIGAFLELDGGDRLGRAARPAPVSGELEPGRDRSADGGRLLLGAGEGALRLDERPARRAGGRWTPAAYLRGHGRRRARGRERVPTPPRRVAFEVLRRVFEHGAWADRALPAARRALRRSRGASAPRRSASPTGRSSAGAPPITSSSSSPSARPGRLDPPVLAALRLGLYELLPLARRPTTPRSTRRSSSPRSAGAARAAGFVNAVLRRAARERGELLDSLQTTRPRQAAAVATRCPPGWPRCGGTSWAPERRRSLMAADNEPAERALRVNRCAPARRTVCERLAAAGVEAAAAERRAARSAPPESLVVDGPLTGALSQRSRPAS